MKIKNFIYGLILFLLFLNSISIADELPNALDELNPFDPNIEMILKNYDRIYEQETGLNPFPFGLDFSNILGLPTCRQLACPVYAQIVKSEQKLYLHINGILQSTWSVSTGKKNFETPLFNTHPNGRIYEAYSSAAFPGGDYHGLGNMPYAVFIYGGFAIHGTVQSNWPLLGQKASHGCIRLHPDNGKYFNRLVRSVGVTNTWVSVQP